MSNFAVSCNCTFSEMYAYVGAWLKKRQRVRRDRQRTVKRSNWRSIIAQNTDEFCRNTTIHGFKYVNNTKLYASDRAYFALAVLIVLIVAGFLIYDAFEKWNTTPVIVSINPVPTYITNEPFPAVTICNLNQAAKSKAEQFSRDTLQFAMLQLLCKNNVEPRVANTITNWSGLETFIYNISQPCHDMVVGCRFGAEDFQCAEMFYPIVTDEGLCCVFNMLHPSYMYRRHIPPTLRNISSISGGGYRPVNWYAEQGYPAKLPAKYYPRPAQGTGESLGLSLILDVQADDYYCSSSNSIGFKMALHSPNESPNVRETGVLLAPGWETKARIGPTKIITEQHLRSVHRKYRRCLFHSEGRLQYFAHYTQRNCEMECLAQLLLTHCGCVSFYMPKIDENATICSIRKSSCVESVRLHTDTSVEYCLDACLPSCYDLSFDVDAFSTKITSDRFVVANPLVEHFNRTYVARGIAIVNMYFKDHSFRSHKQTEFIGVSDFLSSVGGLMGLFLGFSFVSIAECIYFAIIRPWRAFAELRRQKKLRKLPQRDYATHINQKWHHEQGSSKNADVVQVSGNLLLSISESMERAQQQQNGHRRQPLQRNWLTAVNFKRVNPN